MPSGFRNALANSGSLELMARRSNHSPCIEMWPKAVFDAQVSQRTEHLDPFTLDYEKLVRRLVGRAHPLLPDSEGRVILPRELIEKAGLDSEVVFTGRNIFFQLWSAQRWEAVMAEDDAEEAE